MSIEQLQGVEMLCQTATETLQKQNAEFLEKYPTDDAQIDYYTDLAMKIFEEFEIDGAWDVEGTRKNVEIWYNNKKRQMELFRKHPYWSEEAKAIIFGQEEERSVDRSFARRLVKKLIDYLEKHISRSNGFVVLEAIQYALESGVNEQSTMDELFISRLNDYMRYYHVELPSTVAKSLRTGGKITRFIRKCCENFQIGEGKFQDVTKIENEHEPDDRTFDSFEKRYAQLADSLSSLKIKKMTLLSLHFCDFMTMSNGNSWSTCHFINSHGIFHDGDTASSYRGAYKQGCLSYALDEPSFIFYTLPTNYKGKEYYRVQKMTRMCCQYQDGILVTGKCYPNNADCLIDRYRQTMQMVISESENVPNLWTFSKSPSRIESLVSTHDYAAHYKDYEHTEQKPTISLCKNHVSIDFDNLMTIGNRAYCVYCGEKLRASGREWLQCENHRQKMVCARCGKRITKDMDHKKLDGNLYCSDCFFYCEVHDRYEIVSELYGTINMEGHDIQVCIEGMNKLAQCEDCGAYGYKKDMLKTHSGHVCKKHYRKYKKCDICGAYMLNKEKCTDDRGLVFCKHCYELFGNSKNPIVQKKKFEVGDYVLFGNIHDVESCRFGANNVMRKYYPNRIARIVAAADHRTNGFEYHVTNLASDANLEAWEGRWAWSRDCFKGVVVGANDSYIGMTLENLGIKMEGN